MRRITLIAAVLVVAVWGCKKAADQPGGASGAQGKTTIQNIGSDTMVNLAQAWAEAYAGAESSVSIEVSGGGSGVGVAALINGTADVANSSRQLEPEEVQKALQQTGKKPTEFLVGYDGLAVYVHKDNPLEQISVEELKEIYREGGTIDRWSQLGVHIPGTADDRIVRVS